MPKKFIWGLLAQELPWNLPLILMHCKAILWYFGLFFYACKTEAEFYSTFCCASIEVKLVWLMHIVLLFLFGLSSVILSFFFTRRWRQKKHPSVFLSDFHVSISSILSCRPLSFSTASPPFHLLNTHFLITMPGPCQEAPREATKGTEPEHLKALCPQRKKSSFGNTEADFQSHPCCYSSPWSISAAQSLLTPPPPQMKKRLWQGSCLGWSQGRGLASLPCRPCLASLSLSLFLPHTHRNTHTHWQWRPQIRQRHSEASSRLQLIHVRMLLPFRSMLGGLADPINWSGDISAGSSMKNLNSDAEVLVSEHLVWNRHHRTLKIHLKKKSFILFSFLRESKPKYVFTCKILLSGNNTPKNKQRI